MRQITQSWEKDGFILRSIRAEDGEAYWEQGFGVDSEVDRLTGSRSDFTREEVLAHFRNCLEAEDRADFLIIGPDGRILGESVVNEIDWKTRCGNFRIALFRSDSCGKGIGSWAVRMTRDYAFETLGLHRLELDVFPSTPGPFGPTRRRASGARASAGRRCWTGRPMGTTCSWPSWRTSGGRSNRQSRQRRGRFKYEISVGRNHV